MGDMGLEPITQKAPYQGGGTTCPGGAERSISDSNVAHTFGIYFSLKWGRILARTNPYWAQVSLYNGRS